METLETLVALLSSKGNKTGCAAMEELERLSEQSDEVYEYFDEIAALLSSANSYERNRAFIVLAANAEWDEDGRFEKIIGEFLLHITDEKPISARQCIKGLPKIARHKPALREEILLALKNADTSKYSESMRPLVDKDIAAAIFLIEQK